ncbi:MAG: hypothetical protein ABI445_19715 [Polyangia bacterium]
MKSWFVVGVAMVGMTGVAAAFPGIGGPKGASAGDLDSFLNDATSANTLMTGAAWSMARAVLSDQEVKKLEDQRKALDNIKDPKERDAQVAANNAAVTSALSQIDYDAASKKIEGADAMKKEHLSSSIWNYSLALLKDTELVARGAKLVSGVPDPAVATRVTRLKGFVDNMKSQIDSGKKMTGGIKKLQAASGMKALPSSSSEKALATAD